MAENWSNMSLRSIRFRNGGISSGVVVLSVEEYREEIDKAFYAGVARGKWEALHPPKDKE